MGQVLFFRDLGTVLQNGRFLRFIVIVYGFWMMFGSYSCRPFYVKDG